MLTPVYSAHITALWNTLPNTITCAPSPSIPLTTNDNYSRHRNSAACYQLAQSVLKIGSALVEITALAERAWRLLQLSVERQCWVACSSAFLYIRV